MGIEYRPEPAGGAKVAIVVAQFNAPLTRLLLDGALAELQRCSGDADVLHVPGAFELAQAAAWVQQRAAAPAAPGQVQGIAALGCLLKGETDHYAVLAAEAARRLGQVAAAGPLPLSFGVLTCQSAELALERADPAGENRGGAVMRALLEMIALQSSLGD